MVILKNLFLTLFSFMIISCSGQVATTEKEVLDFSDIVVTESGADEENSFCKKFNLSGKQAALFFKRSYIITIKVMHDKYDYLPCYVVGTSLLKKSQCEWEVRAGGTAEVTCEDANYILACDQCDDILRD